MMMIINTIPRSIEIIPWGSCSIPLPLHLLLVWKLLTGSGVTRAQLLGSIHQLRDS